jgi:hypothetical protein
MHKDFSTFEVIIPTRIWDTFAEPNNYTIPGEVLGQNQASIRLGGPRPKSRLTVEDRDYRAAQNLSFMGFRNHHQVQWVLFLLSTTL